ncbi:MAG: hypothetical protein H7325_06425 [Pedobacter sp.]|nr:hypothetical protein [Pedobacter sp.]
MRNAILLFCTICLLACSKEKGYGPLQLKNGQIVELLVSDKYGSDQDQLLMLPRKDAAQASLYNFIERKPGFIYKVRAKFVREEVPPQDGAEYYFEFQSIINQEKYMGNESFTIPLIVSYVPGGPSIQLNKINDKFFFRADKIQLTYTTDEVKEQLEEIWQNALETHAKSTQPKWMQIKATVKHDPEKFGEAYLVERIEFL